MRMRDRHVTAAMKKSKHRASSLLRCDSLDQDIPEEFIRL